MIPLFLITEINEIKHFTSEAKSSNFKQDNHYWLFIQSLSEYSLSYSKPSSIISTSSSLLSNTPSQVSSLWFSQERQLQRSTHRYALWLPKQSDVPMTAARYQLN